MLMGKKQSKSPAKPAKPNSAAKASIAKASGNKRPAYAAVVRDDAINEAEQKRIRLQENLWALEKQVVHVWCGFMRAGTVHARSCLVEFSQGCGCHVSDAQRPALMPGRSLCRYMTLRPVT